MTISGEDDDSDRGPTVLRSVTNALAILEAFDPAHPELGVSELARRLDLAPSTVHRLLATLVAKGFIEPTGHRTYRLGLRPIEIGSAALQHRGFGSTIQPAMLEVARKTNETVKVAILDGDEIVYVAVLETSATSRRSFEIGQRGPALQTALGKVLVAWQADPEAWPAERRPQLTVVRREGVAYDPGDSEPSVISVAVPILDRQERVLAAIGVAGPAFRMTQARMSSMIPILRQAAAAIARGAVPRGPERFPSTRDLY